jgi:hypothetical protein
MARGMGTGSTCPAALSGPIRAGEAQLAGPAQPAVIPNRGPGPKRASGPLTLVPCSPDRFVSSPMAPSPPGHATTG